MEFHTWIVKLPVRNVSVESKSVIGSKLHVCFVRSFLMNLNLYQPGRPFGLDEEFVDMMELSLRRTTEVERYITTN